MRLRSLLLATACTAFAASFADEGYSQTAAPAGARTRGASTPDYLPVVVPRPVPLRHYLYIATPGDTGADDQSGIVVLDADHSYRFVKRISYGLPAGEMPGAKITGITASVPENMIFVANIGQLIAFDLGTDKIAWTFKGDPGGVAMHHLGSASITGCCERPWTLPDGKTLFVNSSYNDWVYYINAATGESEGKVMVPNSPVTHNLVVSPDGKVAVIGSESGVPDGHANASVVDVPARKVRCTFTFSDEVRPLTLNHNGNLVYVNVNNLDGFEIGDTKTCKVLKRVELPGEMWKAKWANPIGYHFGHGLPSHGIGMTPDESEIWVTDGANSAWQVWDNPPDGLNPVYNPSKTVKLDLAPGVDSSWIDMTNDGKTAFLGDGSIVDVKSHKVIGTMKDEYGHSIHATEKALYLTFQGDKLVETNNQFADGDPKAYAERVTNKQASN